MTDEEFEREARKRGYTRGPNNPKGEPVGHYTGRCINCGSKDLWDDNMHYGCNACGAFWCFG